MTGAQVDEWESGSEDLDIICLDDHPEECLRHHETVVASAASGGNVKYRYQKGVWQRDANHFHHPPKQPVL